MTWTTVQQPMIIISSMRTHNMLKMMQMLVLFMNMIHVCVHYFHVYCFIISCAFEWQRRHSVQKGFQIMHWKLFTVKSHFFTLVHVWQFQQCLQFLKLWLHFLKLYIQNHKTHTHTHTHTRCKTSKPSKNYFYVVTS